MTSSSQIIVTAVIWGLTATGGFFGIRGMLRRRQRNRVAPPRPPDPHRQG